MNVVKDKLFWKQGCLRQGSCHEPHGLWLGKVQVGWIELALFPKDGFKFSWTVEIGEGDDSVVSGGVAKRLGEARRNAERVVKKHLEGKR